MRQFQVMPEQYPALGPPPGSMIGGEPLPEGPIQPGSGRSEPLWKKLAAPLVVVGLLLSKFKAVLLLLPKIKILTTSGSMLVSIVAYQLIFGWPFAVGFVLLLLVHEMGHVFQLRREGIEASAPMFIPFLGAVVAMKSLPDDAGAEARVGLAGPVLGSIAALVPLGIYFATGEEFWRALAYVGFFINLFNLLPVLPLDGGRAMAALSPKVWLVGMAALVAMVDLLPEPDPDPDRDLRRARDLAALEDPQHARGPGLPRRPEADASPRCRRLPRPRRAAGARRLRDSLRAHARRRLILRPGTMGDLAR